jgi:hypothetical protein
MLETPRGLRAEGAKRVVALADAIETLAQR